MTDCDCGRGPAVHPAPKSRRGNLPDWDRRFPLGGGWSRVCDDCKAEAIDRYDVGSYRVNDVRNQDEHCPGCGEPVGLWQDEAPVKAWEVLLVENGEVREAIESGFCSRRCALIYRAKHFGREAWEAWRKAAEGC